MSKREHKISPKRRINIVMQYLMSRGANKESVNEVYRNIIDFEKHYYDEDESLERMKVIGQNGNTGEHYEK